MGEIKLVRSGGKTILSFYTGSGKNRRLAERVILDKPSRTEEHDKVDEVVKRLRGITTP